LSAASEPRIEVNWGQTLKAPPPTRKAASAKRTPAQIA
jgi:hypothetical protein